MGFNIWIWNVNDHKTNNNVPCITYSTQDLNKKEPTAHFSYGLFIKALCNLVCSLSYFWHLHETTIHKYSRPAAISGRRQFINPRKELSGRNWHLLSACDWWILPSPHVVHKKDIYIYSIYIIETKHRESQQLVNCTVYEPFWLADTIVSSVPSLSTVSAGQFYFQPIKFIKIEKSFWNWNEIIELKLYLFTFINEQSSLFA